MFTLRLEKPPKSKWKRSAAALLRAGRDRNVLHTRNAASERVWGIQTRDKPSTSLKRPRQPCSATATHSLCCWRCASSPYPKMNTATLIQTPQLLTFTHFKPLLVTFNKIMFNKTKSRLKSHHFPVCTVLTTTYVNNTT